MKKTLALVLSVMMVLSLFAGMFSFTASAAEKGYAETEADKLWAAADTVKATSLTLQIGSAKNFERDHGNQHYEHYRPWQRT